MTPRVRVAAKPAARAATAPLGSSASPGASANWRQFAVPIAVLGIVLAMIAPLPPFLLDILISANITLSVIVLLVSLYITKPVEFSVFPTTLLLMTLFRLALNISSARLILLNGNTGTAAAGDVIQAFGAFVVGGNYVIGVVIFLVLIAIQYVVINHGAVRISEVTARFTLDAMPGKQMSIDSDLNSGLIDEHEARSRRRMLASEADLLKNQLTTDISQANYDFRFIGEKDVDHQACFVLAMLPRRKDKNLLHGTVWVDASSYLVRRVEGEPAKSASMWLRNVRIVLSYGDVSGMWLQTSSESTADVLLLGSHRMVSRDTNYQIGERAMAAEKVLGEPNAHRAGY